MSSLDNNPFDLINIMKQQMGIEYSPAKQKNSENIKSNPASYEINNFDIEFSVTMKKHPFHYYLRYIFVHLLISNEEATATVVKHFNSNIREYMNYYKNEFDAMIYIESFNPGQIIHLKILECVVSYGIKKDANIEKFIYDLIKKNNRSIYNHVKNVADTKNRTFNYSLYLEKRLAKIKPIDYLPFMLKSKNEIMAAYLFCLRHELIMYAEGDEAQTLIEMAYNDLTDYEIALDEEQEVFQLQYINPNREKYAHIKTLHNIDITKPIIVRDLVLRMLRLDVASFDHNYFKFFVNLLLRSTHFDMNPRELFHQALITPEQIDIIVHQYHEIEHLIGDSEINLQFRDYVVIQLVIITILNEYKKIKNAFTGYLDDSFEQLAEVYEEEMNNDYENQLEQKNNEILSLQSDNEKLQLRIKQMEAQLKDSGLQQKRLEKELERIQPKEELLREVHALREYMYLHNEAVQVAEVTSYEQVLYTLKNKDILLVGGHNNMTNKIKEVLPTIDIYNIDQLGKTPNFSKYEHVFFYWSICNHAAYNKTLSQISHSKGKFHYLSGSTNIELVTTEMYCSIKD